MFRRPARDDVERRREHVMGDARDRFGGFDWSAAFAGMLAGFGLTVLLGGLLAAAGSVGYEQGIDGDDLSAAGFVAGLAVLIISFLTGGWVAGRMARYDGARNGLLASVLFVLFAAALSGLGAAIDARYDYLDEVNAPQWFSGDTGTIAVASAATGIVLMLVAGAMGGLRGSRWHRDADDALTRLAADDAADRTDVVAGTARARVVAPVTVTSSAADGEGRLSQEV